MSNDCWKLKETPVTFLHFTCTTNTRTEVHTFAEYILRTLGPITWPVADFDVINTPTTTVHKTAYCGDLPSSFVVSLISVLEFPGPAPVTALTEMVYLE